MSKAGRSCHGRQTLNEASILVDKSKIALTKVKGLSDRQPIETFITFNRLKKDLNGVDDRDVVHLTTFGTLDALILAERVRTVNISPDLHPVH